ncbi:multidrug DMT transporter permease [Pontibacter beigongshangensis]|uniref:multidrug DMT transporter permease n=1 Tax=Pontibacter beigongshangensis TaxID=2574733 RepID=UPI0016501D2C|nr:multidrug DMT transporter permease [Pontibacter beigongshangensis]
MFILENYGLAVAFCLVTMICWGSWANTQKLADKNWRFELYYWDYVIGILALSLVFAFTLGSTGGQGRGFLDDIAQADSANIRSAIIGGVVFNLSNILLVAATAIAGMSVAFPVGIGIALILGVIDNYADNPIGNATVLFSGVGLVALAILLNAAAYRRLTRTVKKVSTKGLLLAVISGCLMGLFYGFVATSMAKDFSNPEAGYLTPYTAVVFFAVGVFISNFIVNTILMKFPFEGAPVSYADYFKGSGRSHLMGVLGGAIWCIGMSFNIVASGKAGPAIAYGLGQGATVVAAVWGIYIWREFKAAPQNTGKLLNSMLLFYVIGIGLIIVSRSI